MPSSSSSQRSAASLGGRLWDWLVGPAPTVAEAARLPGVDELRAVDEALFLATTRMWPRLGLLLAAGALAWWPADLLLFADDPHAQRVFAVFRLGIIVPNVIMALVGPLLRPLFPYWVPLLSLVVIAEVAWAGACMRVASHGDPAWFGLFYLAPFFTILLLVPLAQRVVVATLVSIAAWCGFHLGGAAWPHLAAMGASQLGFTTVLAIALGHWFYGALRTQLLLRGRLATQHEVLAGLTATLEARVAAQGADLLALSRRAWRARVEERRRVGRDLHDDLGQELTALALLVETLDAGDDARSAAVAQPLRAITARARESLSRVLDDLRPRLLDEVGMEDAVRELVRERCEAAGLQCRVEVGAVALPVREAVAVAAFRVVQEGLNNVLRHANARRVRLSIEQDGTDLVVILSDDGQGMRSETTTGHGLEIIRERCAALGGDAVWTGDAGTTLRAWLPLGGAA